jgi:hypothetical protein
MGAAGTQSSFLLIGGSPNTTEFWNGSSWTELADLATPRQGLRACGSSTSAVAFGGGSSCCSNRRMEQHLIYVVKNIYNFLTLDLFFKKDISLNIYVERENEI